MSQHLAVAQAGHPRLRPVGAADVARNATIIEGLRIALRAIQKEGGC
jgi:hypothetical protein